MTIKTPCRENDAGFCIFVAPLLPWHSPLWGDRGVGVTLMTEKTVSRIGWFATVMGVTMFFSYVDQIRLNISGHPGSVMLPIITTINCTAWVLYASLKTKRDWPVIVSNAPGILLGIITAITAIIYK